MNSPKTVKQKAKVRVPIKVTPVALSRNEFKDKALKAYFENKRRRSLVRLNLKRELGSLSDFSDEERGANDLFIEKLWEDYQSFFINAPENIEFDIDQAIEQYLSEKEVAQRFAPIKYIEEYYIEKEEELNGLLQEFQTLSLDSDPFNAFIVCPICTAGSLELKDEDYFCKICNIRAKNQFFSDFCTAKAMHRKRCPSLLSLTGKDGYFIPFCSECGEVSIK